jgi:GTPase SAR1 family protein
MSRRRTTGIVEAGFMDEGAKWTVVDVGGQRSERRKWLLCFDGVDAVIFFVNSAGFNRPLFEDNQVTEHQEALSLLEQTFSNKIFTNTPVFLFFNKLDLFRDALDRGRPIGKYFPEYKGNMEEIPMLDHLNKLYQTKMPNQKPIAQVHFLSACNRMDVQKAFKRVREYLISNKHNTIKAEKEGERPLIGAEVFTPPREEGTNNINIVNTQPSSLDLPGTPTNLRSTNSEASTTDNKKNLSNVSTTPEPGAPTRETVITTVSAFSPVKPPVLKLPADIES